MVLSRSGSMLLQKNFKNIDAVMGILVRFEEILWKISLNFFAPNSEFFAE